MKLREFKCPECGRTTISRYRVFKCLRCGYEPPIDDYKKAFEDLQEVVEYEKSEISKWSKSAWEMERLYKNTLRILLVTNIFTGVLLGGAALTIYLLMHC